MGTNIVMILQLCRVNAHVCTCRSALSAFARPSQLKNASRHSSSRRTTCTTSSLPRHPLGHTGYEVCTLGFGASPLGAIYSVSTRVATIKLARKRSSFHLTLRQHCRICQKTWPLQQSMRLSNKASTTLTHRPSMAKGFQKL